MVEFPIFWVFTSADYYSSMKDKSPTFYVSSSCLFATLKFTDTNEYEAEETANILCCFYTGKSLIIIKKDTSNIEYNDVSTFSLL